MTDPTTSPATSAPRSDQSVIAVFDTLGQAEGAVRSLDGNGFPIRQVSIVSQNLQNEREVQGFVTTGDVAWDGAASGAWAGGLFGLLVGSAFLWVPVFGPLFVVGSLAATIAGGVTGAAVGAAAGGVLGALLGVGVSRQHILKYEDHVKAGRYLLIAHGSAAEVERAYAALQHAGARDLTLHAEIFA